MSRRVSYGVAAVLAAAILLSPARGAARQSPRAAQAEGDVAKAVRDLLDTVSTAAMNGMRGGGSPTFRLGSQPVTFAELDATAAGLVSGSDAALGYRLRGLLQMMRHQYREAEASLSASINVVPAAHPYYLRGLLRLALGQYPAGVDDMTACLARSPAASLVTECQSTLAHARNAGVDWVSYRDTQDGIAFSHPADWDVLSARTPKVLEYFLSVGLSRDAASQLATGIRQAGASFLVVNPYDATAITLEVRDLGEAVPKSAVATAWRASNDAAQFERQNAGAFRGIRVRSHALVDTATGLRIEFAFGFQLPVFEAALNADGWRTMVFYEKVPTRTVRIEHVADQQFREQRQAILTRLIDTLVIWSPGAAR